MENRILGLQAQVKIIRDNINTLELRQAKYGLDIPISLLNEIKQLRTELGEKEEELRYILEVHPKILELYDKLVLALDNNRYERSVQLCDEITELYPGYYDVIEKRIFAQDKLNDKAQEDRKKGKLSSALDEIEKLIEIDDYIEARAKSIPLLRENFNNDELKYSCQKIDRGLQAQKNFVGRKSLLNKMMDKAESVSLKQGNVFLVNGEPGVGKTYLVSEFISLLQKEHPNLVATFGSCSPYGDTSDAYEPFREAFEILFGETVSSWDENYLLSLENFIRVLEKNHIINNAINKHGHSLVNTLVSPEKLRRIPELSTNEGNKESLFNQFIDVIKYITENYPLVIVLDDFQWANRSSIDLFSNLARNIKTLPIILIVIYRNTDLKVVESDEHHPFLQVFLELKRRYGDIEVSVSSNSVNFVHEYLNKTYAPNKFSSQFVNTIAERTGDNALFISELLLYLISIGSIHQDREGYWIAPKLVDSESFPVKIEAVIEERINQLESDLQNILIGASVEGKEFTAQVLSSIQEIEERQILKQLTQGLHRRYRLIEENGARIIGKQRLYFFRFRHILFQQYLYNQLTDLEREILHQDVGLCLEELFSSNLEQVSHLLVRHFQEAHDFEKTIKYAMMAGHRMVDAFAYHEAISYYDQALDSINNLEQESASCEFGEVKAKALYARGNVFLEIEYLKEAIVDYENALSLNILPTSELLKKIGRAKEFMGYWNDAYINYQQCIESYRQENNRVGVIEITIRLGAISKQLGEWDKSLGYLFQAMEQSKEIDSEYWEARAVCNIGMVYYRKQDWKNSLRYHTKDLEISKKLNDLVGIERSLSNTGEVYLNMEQTDKAIEALLESTDLFEKLGGGQHPVTHRNIGIAYLKLHNFEQAMKHLNISLDVGHNQNRLQEIAWTLYEIGNLYVVKKDLEQAKKYFQESIEYAEQINDRWRLAHSLLALAQVFDEEENLQEAVILLERAQELAVDIDDNDLRTRISKTLTNIQNR